jgi:peptide/nickel transport system substrate-binding protein
MKKHMVTAVFIFALMLILAACDQQPAAETLPAQTEQAQAEDGQDTQNDAEPTRDNVLINLTADIDLLDPHNTASSSDFAMFPEIFSRLVRQYHQDFLPSLATSWELAEDGLSYTFWLRDDVTFHNGDPFTAHDVVFSYERAMASPFVGAPLAPISGVTAVDDFQVRFDLHHQFAPFMTTAPASIWIVGENSVNEAGDNFGRYPIGTGPYRFVEHQPGRSIYLSRFDDYFGPTPAIRDIAYMIILNPATVSIAVEAGDIDIGVHVPPGDVLRLEEQAGLNVTRFDTTHINFITLNATQPPFDNPLVREAIARSIDRQGLITMVADGFGTPANGIFNELTFGFSPDVTPFARDDELARELLAEAGFPDGFDTTIRTIGGAFESPAQVLQANLANIGIRATIELMDQAVFIGDLFAHNYEIGVLAMSLGTDANGWDMVLTSEGGMNMTGLGDPDIDAWFEEGRIVTDPAARVEIYRNIAQRVNDTAAFIPIYFTSAAFVHNSDLQLGWIDAVSSFRVSDMRWLR